MLFEISHSYMPCSGIGSVSSNDYCYRKWLVKSANPLREALLIFPK